MFMIELLLVTIAIVSLPIALLELQLLYIGVSGLTATHLFATLFIGVLSAIGAGLVEVFSL